MLLRGGRIEDKFSLLPTTAGRHRQTAYLRYRALGTFVDVPAVRDGAEDEAGVHKKIQRTAGREGW